MKYFLRIMLAVLLLGLLLYKALVVPVPEGFKAVVTHLGDPNRILETAGAHIKWPWPIDDVYLFDCRARVYNTKYTQTLTRDKKSLILLTYIVWSIDNPLLFLQSVGTAANAEDKIESLVSSSKNNVLGGYDLANLVSTDEKQIKLKEIEKSVFDMVVDKAHSSFGVKIISLGIKRIAFPENNVKAIFGQMRAERGQYAAKYRAEGRMEASMILSEADLEIAKINAEAVKQAAQIRGEADSKASEIYAEAHKKGREFYKFTRSLEALEKIVNVNAVFLLRSDQSPFDVLNESSEADK